MKWVRPMDQWIRSPSELHAGNCPPMSVSFRTGNAAVSGVATETVGAVAPTWGTVTT
jgi:hypothetical protein